MTIKNDLIPITNLIYNKINFYMSSIEDVIERDKDLYQDIYLSANDNISIKMNIQNRGEENQTDEYCIQKFNGNDVEFTVKLSMDGIYIETDNKKMQLEVRLDPTSNDVKYVFFRDLIRRVTITPNNEFDVIRDNHFCELSSYEFKELIDHLYDINIIIDKMSYDENLTVYNNSLEKDQARVNK